MKTIATGIIFLLAGALTIWGGFVMQDRNRHYLTEGIIIDATVTGKNEIRRPHKKSRMYVRYAFTVDDKQHEENAFWEADTKSWQALSKGGAVRIAYLVDPASGQLKSQIVQNLERNQFAPMLGIGVVFFLVGLIVAGKGVRRS